MAQSSRPGRPTPRRRRSGRRRRGSGGAPPSVPLLPLDRVLEILERAFDLSPADETELVWIETFRRHADSGRATRAPLREGTLLIRVLEQGRLGAYRTDSCEPGAIADGIRQAIAQSRGREPLAGLPRLPADPTPAEIEARHLYDPEMVALAPTPAREQLASRLRTGESGRLDWCVAHVAVCNSRGLRRRVAVTAAELEIRCGTGPGAGRAIAGSRSLRGLAPETVLDAARRRRAEGEVAELPPQPLPAVLSPEATITLCEVLNRVALSALSYHDGISVLREHLGVQVFDRRFHLRDDGTDLRGLPFPFDLEGTAKHPVDLVVDGIPRTPALDQRQAAALGLQPTGHAIGGNDARALNVFMGSGTLSDEELLAAADGGIWIGWLDPVECFDPSRVRIRACARGVRRIRDARLAEPLPDLVWEPSLLGAFSNLLGLGAGSVLSSRGEFLGGFRCPAVALADLTEARPADL